MSNEIKITEARKGKAGSVGIVIEHGGEKFVHSKHGLYTFAEPGVKPTAVTGAKADHLIQGSMRQIAGKGALPESVKESLPNIGKLYAGQDAEIVKMIEAKGALVTAAKGKDVAAIEAAVSNLPKGVAHTDVLNAEQVAKAEKTGFDFAKHAKEAKEAADKIAKSEAAVAEVKKVIETKGVTPAQINDSLIKNYEHLDEIGKLQGAANHNLTDAIAEIRGKVGTQITEVEGHYKTYATNMSAHADHVLKGNTEAAEAAKKTAEEALANAQKLTKGEHGAAVTSGLSKETKELVGLHNPAEAKLLGVESAAAKEAGRGWGAKLFLKSEEKLAELATKKGVAQSELGTLSKISKGKAAIWGLGAVGVAYVAGIGSKGKHTDQVASQQAAQQGAAIGA